METDRTIPLSLRYLALAAALAAGCSLIARFDPRPRDADADADADTDADLDTDDADPDLDIDIDDGDPDLEDAERRDADHDIDERPTDADDDVDPDIEADDEECVPRAEIQANCIDEDCLDGDAPVDGATLDFYPPTPDVGMYVEVTATSVERGHACVSMFCDQLDGPGHIEALVWDYTSGVDVPHHIWNTRVPVSFGAPGTWRCIFNKNMLEDDGCDRARPLDIVCADVEVVE